MRGLGSNIKQGGNMNQKALEKAKQELEDAFMEFTSATSAILHKKKLLNELAEDIFLTLVKKIKQRLTSDKHEGKKIVGGIHIFDKARSKKEKELENEQDAKLFQHKNERWLLIQVTEILKEKFQYLGEFFPLEFHFELDSKPRPEMEIVIFPETKNKKEEK